MDIDRLTEELTCPLTLSLLSDPVTLPCCGKAVSRSSLRSALQSKPSCPLCRTGLGVDVADEAPRNRVAQALLDALSSGGRSGVASSGTVQPPPSDFSTGSVDGTMTALPQDEVPKLTATYCLLPVPSAPSPSTSTPSTPSPLPLAGARQRSDRSSTFSSSSSPIGRIGRLQLRVTNSTSLNLRQILSILVVDKSGSMSGSPWNQASLAMKHIVSMARESHFRNNTTLKIVCYDSRAKELDCNGSVDNVHDRIDQVRASGGTSFRGAFGATLDVMKRAVFDAKAAMMNGVPEEGMIGPSMPGVVQILFLTDGQAHEDRSRLAEELRGKILKFRADCLADADSTMVEPPDVTVHSVGFSSGCDKTLLEQIRNAGTTPGQFRYCEPGDSEDALCGRLTGMFEGIAAHGGCEVEVERLLLPAPSGRGEEMVDGPSDVQQSPPSWEFLGQDGEVLSPNDRGKVKLQLRTKPDGVGTATAWVSINAAPPTAMTTGQQQSGLVLPIAVTCNAGQTKSVEDATSSADDDVEAKEETAPAAAARSRPDWTITATDDSAFSSIDAVKRAWVGVRIHVLAEDAIACVTAATGRPSFPEEAVRLWGSFLEHRLRAVSTLGSDAHDRVPALLEQLQGLSNWKNGGSSLVSVGKLRDISSASAYSSSRAPIPTAGGKSGGGAIASVFAAASVARPLPVYANPTNNESLAQHNREECVHYSGSNDAMKRNALQSAIMDWGQRHGADGLVSEMLGSMTAEEVAEAVVSPDTDGNTSVHLAAYNGQFDALPLLLDAAPFFDVDTPNDYGETPVTIAIKKRGYHKSVEVIQSLGGSIPEERVDSLIAHCNRCGFPRTGAYLRKCQRDGTLGGRVGDKATPKWTLQSAAELPPLVFEEGMARVAVQSRLRAAVKAGRPIDWVSLVRVGLRFPEKDLVRAGLDHVTPDDVDPAWVFADCFPRKPDAPDTPTFLEMLELMLDFAPVLESTAPESGDTLLHRAVAAGSLPHVECLVSRGLHPDVTNTLGNTPLLVACTKRYPCIVDFFITAGADVNGPNSKGMTPIGTATQMGSLRIVETLIAAGAMVDGPCAVVTTRGENLLHVAIRNNQPDILALLLDRADPDTMLEMDNDGFTPILASVEGDRKECLNLLLDSATDYTRREIPGFASHNNGSGDEATTVTTSELPILEWKTPTNSSSPVPGATALHVAVNYNRRLALSTLLGRGANPNVTDVRGLTPLHHAAQRGNADAVYALIAHGASPTAVDKSGRTPATYGRSHPDVMAALVGPVPGPLHAFAAGTMDPTAMAACVDVVKRAATLAAEPGLFDSAQVLDLPLDEMGQTALMVSVSHGNVFATETLFGVGSSATKCDRRGLTATDWAQMVKSQRILGILGAPAKPLLPGADRHAMASKRYGSADAMAIFLGGRRDPSWPSPTAKTTLHKRLVLLAEAFGTAYRRKQEVGATSNAITLLRAAPRTGSVDRVTIAPPGSAEQRALDADRWSCKIAAAGSVAAAIGGGGDTEEQHQQCRPAHVFVPLLATQHGPLVPSLNEFLDQCPASPAEIPMAKKSVLDFAVALYDSLEGPVSQTVEDAFSESDSPTPSTDAASSGSDETEVYALAPPGLARSALCEGTVLALAGFASATTEWSIALSALDASHGIVDGTGPGAFQSGKGVVLIIAPPAQRRTSAAQTLWSRSAFPEDREVMFSPGARFRVCRWYRGDLQALGRRSVRETTPRLQAEEIARLASGGGSVVVELEEL